MIQFSLQTGLEVAESLEDVVLAVLGRRYGPLISFGDLGHRSEVLILDAVVGDGSIAEGHSVVPVAQVLHEGNKAHTSVEKFRRAGVTKTMRGNRFLLLNASSDLMKRESIVFVVSLLSGLGLKKPFAVGVTAETCGLPRGSIT